MIELSYIELESVMNIIKEFKSLKFRTLEQAKEFITTKGGNITNTGVKFFDFDYSCITATFYENNDIVKLDGYVECYLHDYLINEKRVVISINL